MENKIGAVAVKVGPIIRLQGGGGGKRSSGQRSREGAERQTSRWEKKKRSLPREGDGAYVDIGANKGGKREKEERQERDARKR